MLPTQSMPPFAPGSFNSPFGAPQIVDVDCGGIGCYALPHGAWYVNCDGGTWVVFLIVPWQPDAFANPCRAPGTGLIFEPFPVTDPRPPPDWLPCPPPPPVPSQPDEWVLVQPGCSGLVLADGENVLITGSGTATIIQAFSV
jgi:hypothetical protein